MQYKGITTSVQHKLQFRRDEKVGRNYGPCSKGAVSSACTAGSTLGACISNERATSLGSHLQTYFHGSGYDAVLVLQKCLCTDYIITVNTRIAGNDRDKDSNIKYKRQKYTSYDSSTRKEQ